jgi:methionyl-tRNA formyltransferase
VTFAILTYESGPANYITRHLLERFPGRIRGLLRSSAIVHGKSALASYWFLLRRSGLSFLAHKGAEVLLGRRAAALIGLTARMPPVPSLRRLGAAHRVPLADACDVNAPGTLALLRAWQPDLLVSVHFNQRLGTEVLALPPQGALNVHGALLPRNRGLFPHFWALANGDAEDGVTVHWMDAGIDTGDIVLQEPIAITPDATAASLGWDAARVGAELLVRAIGLIERGEAPHIPQEGHASYLSWPTAADMRRLRERGRRYGLLPDVWKAPSQSG